MVTPYDKTRIRRVINKGTKIITEDLKKPNWAGEDFHDYETERFSLAGYTMISSAKGTHKVLLSNINRKRPIAPKGQTISSKRGTSLVKLD